MRKYLLKGLAIGILCFINQLAWAQLDNRAFQYRPAVRADYQNQLRLAVQGFLFTKDNEYFNKIFEGRTYYGTQLAPRLVYFPSAEIRLEAGVFLWKDYGTPRLRQVRPLFTAIYQHGPHRIVFGNIDAHLNHGYIEPIFDFERVMLNRLEEGMQYQLNTRRISLDAWVDWQRQQYRFSNFQEEVAGGLVADAKVVNDSTRGWLVRVPFQFLAIHRGGQIDTLDKPLTTLFNVASGVRVRKELASSFFHAVHADAYGVYYHDYSFTKVLPYKSGTGLYLNAGVDTRLTKLQLGYWRGNGFIAPQGGPLYQSISYTVNSPGYTEKRRELLIARFFSDYQLTKGLTLSTRFEPFYDFTNRYFEFSFGTYINFNTEFFLTTLRRE
ncbi:hypothetical protein F0P96_07025 [Hymenobacter busanensis]|uniref:Uncharacterized protein n=1 Tax=Hymenobacter busanensis TaxID=2607656 RepID=A0A7L5A1W5_9BACT|nr:hypothetical protein [Hymenobacter busanensis]KAA9338576.1 hypothetical protein F0P96_07025 [Hymenobacter busanensis]QHJ08995.1 hypothetical protein GUY19_17575 [Hymenobacter busanensis]